jgi:hypothetical protein
MGENGVEEAADVAFGHRNRCIRDTPVEFCTLLFLYYRIHASLEMLTT